MKSLKVILGVSLASLSVFSYSSDSFAESASTFAPSEVTSVSNIEVKNPINSIPNEEIYEVTVEPQSITLQATSASFEWKNFGKGSGEKASNNSISWSGNNKTVTLTVRQYEHISSTGNTETTGDAHIIYDLESSSGNRAGAKQLDGLFNGSNTGTVTWSNVKPGTYNLIIKNNGTRYATASGTFAAQ
ncbi:MULTISPECIES: hypothetical protein [Paenibacillus]|uniref:hypothetical protein n=1 Tax=Paenibacillus TaxID=44249 RepID=UPI000B88DD24|nr:hypothetical protein [Paenibacillus amylolyticus]